VPLLQKTRRHRSELARGIGCRLILFSWISWISWAMQLVSRNDRWPPGINRNSGRAASCWGSRTGFRRQAGADL
jgi:hypothetical protein